MCYICDLRRSVSEVQKEHDQVQDERDSYIRALYEQNGGFLRFICEGDMNVCVLFVQLAAICV